MIPVIEVVRGLGLGGSEMLLANRLAFEARSGANRTSQVMNTHSPENYLQSAIRDLGVTVTDLEVSSRWVSAWKLWRASRAFPREAVLVVHSPWPSAVLKMRKLITGSPQRIVEVAHSTRYAVPTMLLGRVLNRHASLCIAVSDDVAGSGTTRGFRRVVTVLAGVNRAVMREWIEAHDSAPETFRRSLGLEANQRILVSVGNLLVDKRHRLLVSALASLPSDLHIVVVGEGPERARLEALARDLGVSRRLHLVGRVADAWRWMSVADAVVHPSSREGLPISITEARALGVPVVAFDVGGVATVLDGHEASVVIPLGREEALVPMINLLLDQGVAAGQAFSQRASEATFWDVERFSNDFYRWVTLDDE